jgi:hypothetical protein
MAREPLVATQQITVKRRDAFPSASMLSSIRDKHDEISMECSESMLVCNKDPDTDYASAIWTPSSSLLMTLPLNVSLGDQCAALGVWAASPTKVVEIKWELYQIIDYKFSFDRSLQRRYLSDSDARQSSRAMFASGSFDKDALVDQNVQSDVDVQVGESSNEFECVLQLDLNTDDLLPDISTDAVKISHSLQVQVKTLLGSSDCIDAETKVWDIQVPVHVSSTEQTSDLEAEAMQPVAIPPAQGIASDMVAKAAEPEYFPMSEHDIPDNQENLKNAWNAPRLPDSQLRQRKPKQPTF